MTANTNENNEKIKEKLDYLGLELDKNLEILTKCTSLEYKSLNQFEENKYKVYKYIPINKIQIMLTPTNRLNTIKEKYTLASPILNYISPKTEEDMIKHATLLRMLTSMQIEDIKKIEEQQKILNKQIPFKVKFHKNYLWQIYYSNISDTYFMLFPTEDLDYCTLFYLLKKQLSPKTKEEMIFVPINHEDYSDKFLNKGQISNIEKYLWLFTKQWPFIYEVYDKKDELTIHIVGKTECYENIQSDYKIKLKNKEEANKFYRLLKALFILQTELPHRYKFEVKIDRYGALEFEYNSKKMVYENLSELLTQEYIKSIEEAKDFQKEENFLINKLEELKTISQRQDKEYLQKERQITLYLECRKTFLGKVKYFFSVKKIKKKSNISETNEEINEKKDSITYSKIKILNKDFYTIEDLLKLDRQLDELLFKIKKLRLDVDSFTEKNKQMELKLRNATLYIEEIDKHEKSIFEFWKFANKDENKLLIQGEYQENILSSKLEKSFNCEDDIEEIGIQIDRVQRDRFSREEIDSIYLMTTEVLNIVNNPSNENIISSLEELKKIYEEQSLIFNKEIHDIFGSISEDFTMIKTLGNNKHREVKKDKFKILNITKNTQIEEYSEKIHLILKQLKICLKKAKSPISLPVYITFNEKIKLNGYNVFDINPENIINQDENTIYLYRLNIKKDMSIVYFSNIIYYDNYNKTLPLGMDVSTKGIIDTDMFKLKLINRTDFRLVSIVDNGKAKLKKVYVYDYEIEKGKENDK